MGRRRYVARGVPGGYRVWDNKARRWWGELYELCPDRLLDELNGKADHEKVTALLRFYRSQKLTSRGIEETSTPIDTWSGVTITSEAIARDQNITSGRRHATTPTILKRPAQTQ